MSESGNSSKPVIILARWSDRFIAWLIDAVILTVIVSAFLIAISEIQDYGAGNYDTADITNYLISSVIFFSYFVILEYLTGQTIGKKILNVRIVGMDGERPSMSGVAISSLGKAFILPIDVIAGWIVTNEKRQRICNKLGNTVIIKIKESEYSDLRYVKD